MYVPLPNECLQRFKFSCLLGGSLQTWQHISVHCKKKINVKIGKKMAARIWHYVARTWQYGQQIKITARFGLWGMYGKSGLNKARLGIYGKKTGNVNGQDLALGKIGRACTGMAR